MKKLTIWIIILTIVILIGYDVYVVLVHGTEASISSVIITASYDLPIIPFVSGFLCGHLFWRMKANKDTVKIDKD